MTMSLRGLEVTTISWLIFGFGSTSAAAATEYQYPDIQITAFVKYKQSNLTENLSIRDGAIQIVSRPSEFPQLELRCTAYCPIRWKFLPVKDKARTIY